jgi:hypothetical protein
VFAVMLTFALGVNEYQTVWAMPRYAPPSSGPLIIGLRGD